MAEPGRARLSVGPHKHCLICNVNIHTPGFSCKNIYDITHQVASTSSDHHQGALRIRLEQLLQVSLTEALCHSSLVCEACEKKVSQIEDYYRLVAEFEATFYQTARQYGITDQTLEINRLPSKYPWEFPTCEQDSYTKLLDHVSSQNSPGMCDCPVKPVVPQVEESLEDHPETGVSNETSGGVDSCEAGGHQPDNEEDGARETHGASGDMERNNREDQVTQREKIRSEDGQIKDGEQTPDDGCHGNMACGVSGDVSCEERRTLRSKQSLTSEQPHQKKLKTPVQNKQKGQQGKGYECASCSKSFLKMSSLKQHLKSHSGDKAVKETRNQKCDASFETFTGLEVHVVMHRDDVGLSCDQCGATFGRAAALAAHQKSKHVLRTKTSSKSVKETHETRMKKLPPKASHAMHKKLQPSSDHKKHQCSICQRKFVSEERRTAHEVKCSKEFEQLNLSLDLDADKPYTCIICATSYTTKGAFKQHSYTHRNNKPFKCSFCEAKFLHKKSMKDHVSMKHTGEKPQKAFKCDVCSRAYSHSGDLSKHMTQHARKHICSVCDRAFAGSYKLKEHMRIHTGDRPYACKFCSVTFAQAAYLKSHMRNHDGVKPFLCTMCGMQFVHSTTLKRHMVSHTGLRPYKCSQCPKAFQFEWVLKEHVRIHTGEKPHLCSLCGKNFTQPQHLKTHLRIHTGEKPYSCVICGATYRHLSSFNQHKKSSHGDISFPKGSQKKMEIGHAQQDITAGSSGIGPTGIAASGSVTVDSVTIVPPPPRVDVTSSLNSNPQIVASAQDMFPPTTSVSQTVLLDNISEVLSQTTGSIGDSPAGPSSMRAGTSTAGNDLDDLSYKVSAPNILNINTLPRICGPGLAGDPTTLAPALHHPNPTPIPPTLSHMSMFNPQNQIVVSSANTNLLPMAYGQDYLQQGSKFSGQ